MAIIYKSTTAKNIWVIWAKHFRVIHEVLEAMDNDWHGCINVERHLYMMTNKANISHFCSNCMMSINVFTSAFYFVSDIIIHSFNLIDNNNGTSRQLPLKVQVPLVDQSPIFEVLFIIEFLYVIINSFTMAAINGLISSLVSIKFNIFKFHI